MFNIIYFFLFAFIALSNGQLQTEDGRIDILIGITAGYNDAAGFISQVRSTYDMYKQFINLEFVPWGNTRRDTSGNLICEYGINDCWANRVQRCALNALSRNPDAQMDYIECEFSSTFSAFRQRSLLCAHSVGLSIVSLDLCIMSAVGDALEGPAEELSREPVGTINAVPFIVFNNSTNVALHAQAYRRLESMVCFALADDPTTGITHCRI